MKGIFIAIINLISAKTDLQKHGEYVIIPEIY